MHVHPHAMAEVASVRVAARVRPFTSTELAGAAVEAVFASPETNSVTLGSGAAEKSFVFDHVFAAPTTNAEFYEHCVAPLISRAVDGYNVTVFAYGQTGSFAVTRIIAHARAHQRARERTQTAFICCALVERARACRLWKDAHGDGRLRRAGEWGHQL